MAERYPPAYDSRALLSLSHTPIEDRLYEAMRKAVIEKRTDNDAFSIRRLMALTGITSFATIRRGRTGLINKFSIAPCSGQSDRTDGFLYQVFTPTEIFARRRAAGVPVYPKEVEAYAGPAFQVALERLLNCESLSRRQAQVALCCAEGMTNAQIGEKLHVSEQTVKFHMRHIFAKFDVKRRGELISRLLTPEFR